MLDYITVRARYSLGNTVRFVTRPWMQWTIAPEDATTIFACGFGDGGWHHLRRTLIELDADPCVAPQETTLWRYLKHFQPESISTLACAEGMPLPLFVYPWGTFRKREIVSLKSVAKSRFCGPSADDFIFEEFQRTKALYTRMREHGYRPTTFPNSYIGGTWLVAADGQRRFVVLQGNHRMAVLAHLGCRTIEVRAMPGHITTINENDIARWSIVAAGICSKNHARKVFGLFFSESGHHIARQIGAE